MNPVKLTSISALLEYYDFAIFALLATFISQHYFPSTTKHVADIATFGIFALGYFARPFGGIVFGILGDRFGRKITFLSSIILMTISTFFMGLIPTYTQIGIAAPLLFIFLRLCQGLAYGAELPGSLTFLIEHVQEKNRHLMISVLIASVTLGSALSAFIVFVCEKFLTTTQMQEWGWRIPFLIGGFLAIMCYLIRKKTTETPYFLHMIKHPRFALVDLLRKNLPQTIIGLGLVLLPACCIIFYLSLPTFLVRTFHYSLNEIYLVMTIGNIWTTITLPFFGWLNDKYNKKVILSITAISYILFSYPMFHILYYQTLPALFIFAFLYQTLLAAISSSYLVMLAENFSTEVRFTGSAFCYNLAHLPASLVPVVILTLYQKTSNPLSAIWIFISLALCMLFSIYFSRNIMEKL